MTVIGGIATSTEDREEYRVSRKVSNATIYVATAPTGEVCAEKLNLMVFAGKVLGWVVKFISTTPSRTAAGVQTQTKQPSPAARRIAALWEDVEEMKSLQVDWNGYGSEAPNDFARDLAKQILLSAVRNAVVPNRVAPSAQGGVGICFYRGEKYADIECLNSGEILATLSDGTGRPEVWEVKPTESTGALERIGQYIAS
jgi:hypothetical protein